MEWNECNCVVFSVCAFRNESVVRSKEGDGDGDGAVDKERRPKGRVSEGKCWQSAMIGRTQSQGGRSGAEEEGEGNGRSEKAKSALTLKIDWWPGRDSLFLRLPSARLLVCQGNACKLVSFVVQARGRNLQPGHRCEAAAARNAPPASYFW
jgi:hypothetical protein